MANKFKQTQSSWKSIVLLIHTLLTKICILSFSETIIFTKKERKKVTRMLSFDWTSPCLWSQIHFNPEIDFNQFIRYDSTCDNCYVPVHCHRLADKSNTKRKFMWIRAEIVYLNLFAWILISSKHTFQW